MLIVKIIVMILVVDIINKRIQEVYKMQEYDKEKRLKWLKLKEN